MDLAEHLYVKALSVYMVHKYEPTLLECQRAARLALTAEVVLDVEVTKFAQENGLSAVCKAMEKALEKLP